jgi:hypothetical protein
MLREAGVIALGVEAGGKASLDTLASLRKLIDELPPRRPRREERPEAILPSITEVTTDVPDEDEEDDHEWEPLP